MTLGKSRSAVKKFQCTPGEKNPRLVTLKRIRWTPSLYLLHKPQPPPPPKTAQLSPPKKPLGLENENMQVNAWIPQLYGMMPKRPAYFSPYQGHWGELHDWGMQRDLENSSQNLGLSKGTRLLLTTLLTQKDPPEPLGVLQHNKSIYNNNTLTFSVEKT